jgi:hypothetical protein
MNLVFRPDDSDHPTLDFDFGSGGSPGSFGNPIRWRATWSEICHSVIGCTVAWLDLLSTCSEASGCKGGVFEGLGENLILARGVGRGFCKGEVYGVKRWACGSHYWVVRHFLVRKFASQHTGGTHC